MKNNNNILSLNGKWNYLTDPYDSMKYEDVESLYLNGKIKNHILVPSNWEKGGIENYAGTIYYIKEFNCSISDKENHIIFFEGVDYFTSVVLNGKLVGNHEGYFQKFYFDVSNELKNGRNFLIVKVSAPKEEPGVVWPNKKILIKGIFGHHDCRPGGWSLERGQDNGTGGIWNNVSLITINKLHLKQAKFHPIVSSNLSSSTINVKLFIDNLSEKNVLDTISIKIISPKGKIFNILKKVKLKYGLNIVEDEIVINNPELWETWDRTGAKLYEAEVLSNYILNKKVTFGIKKVELRKGSQFFINNNAYFIRGVNIIPAQYLSELNSQKISKIIRMAKEANINAFRVHAHITCSEFYEECDKEGILIWQDFPLQWTYSETSKFKKNAVRQIKEMVNQLANHSSIAFWCCHNEPGEQVETLDKNLERAVKKEDKTRIVRISSNYEEHAYEGWYWGNKEHYVAAPMGPLVTEFGAQGLPSKKSLQKFIPKEKLETPDWDYWTFHNFQYTQTFLIAEIERGNSTDELIQNSQNYQSELLETAINYYRSKKNSGINGVFQFMFIDGWESISWSVIDYYLKPKKGYYTLKRVFQPTFVFVNLWQKKYLPESQLQMEIFIINDLLKEYSDMSLIIRTKRTILLERTIPKINGNDNIFFNQKRNEVEIPKSLKPGKYSAEVLLFSNHENQSISTNSFEFEIVNKLL